MYKDKDDIDAKIKDDFNKKKLDVEIFQESITRLSNVLDSQLSNTNHNKITSESIGKIKDSLEKILKELE